MHAHPHLLVLLELVDTSAAERGSSRHQCFGFRYSSDLRNHNELAWSTRHVVVVQFSVRNADFLLLKQILDFMLREHSDFAFENNEVVESQNSDE